MAEQEGVSSRQRHAEGACSSITELPRELMKEVLKRTDRSAWRLVSKAACQEVYEGTTALAPSRKEQLAALPLPLLGKCGALEQLSCREIKQLRSIQGLPPGLRELDISGTSVSDLSPLTRCTALRQLTAIDMYCSLGAFGLEICAPRLTSLQRLDLEDKHMTQGSARSLESAFRPLSQLQHLGLFLQSADAGGARALGLAIQQLTALTHLDMQSNRLGGAGMEGFAPGIQHLAQLQELDLAQSHMGAQGARALAAALQGLTRLQRLRLSCNCLGPEGFAALAPATRELRALQLLDLDNNDLLDAEAARALALALRELTALRDLGLLECKLTAAAAEALAPAIKMLPRLHVRLSSQDEKAWLDAAVAALAVSTGNS